MSTDEKPVREIKRYKMKEWRKFKPETQEKLTSTYDVRLTDYLTRKQKIHKYTDVKKGLQYFDKGMKKFDSGQKKFWTEFDKGFDKAGFGKTKDQTTKLWGSNKKRKVTKVF